MGMQVYLIQELVYVGLIGEYGVIYQNNDYLYVLSQDQYVQSFIKMGVFKYFYLLQSNGYNVWFQNGMGVLFGCDKCYNFYGCKCCDF